jgi:hypothetical protein
MTPQPAPDNKISNQIVVNGKKFQVDGTVDLKFTPIDENNPIPVPDPDPDPNQEKPTEGTIKDGGWGGNTDPKTWTVTNMRNPSDQYKVVDDKGVNIATNFTTMQLAQNFINYFLIHPFPPEEEEETGGETGGEGGEQGQGGETGSGGTEGKGKDKNGVQLLQSDGKDISYSVVKDTRSGKNDGIRWNFVVKDWLKTEATGYFRFSKDPVDDEVSIKWSEMSHSDGNDVQCYDSGVSIKDGKSRIRFENPHPKYSGDLANGKGEPLNTKWIGYKGIFDPQEDGTVLVKVYQDAGDNESKPSNNWKEVLNYKDTKYKRNKVHPFVTFRVDDPDKKGQKNLEEKWLSVAKI